MTNSLWSNLYRKFLETDLSSDSTESRYEKLSRKPVLFDGNQQNSFNGIIRLLTKEWSGNVTEKYVVKVNESFANGSQPDFHRIILRIHGYNMNSLIQKSFQHLKGLVIEGSNTEANDWTILDSRSSVACLNDESASN